MEYIIPHIKLCGNGHNICSSCKHKLQNCPTCENHFPKHGQMHWKNWLYEMSVLDPIKHTVVYSLFRSPSNVNTRKSVNMVLLYVLCESFSPGGGWGLSRKLNIMWLKNTEIGWQIYQEWQTFLLRSSKKLIIRQNYSFNRLCVSAAICSVRQCWILCNKV